MDTIGKLLIATGIAAALLGLLFVALSQLGFGRLPGDIVVRRGNFVFYSRSASRSSSACCGRSRSTCSRGGRPH